MIKKVNDLRVPRDYIIHFVVVKVRFKGNCAKLPDRCDRKEMDYAALKPIYARMEASANNRGGGGNHKGNLKPLTLLICSFAISLFFRKLSF